MWGLQGLDGNVRVAIIEVYRSKPELSTERIKYPYLPSREATNWHTT